MAERIAFSIDWSDNAIVIKCDNIEIGRKKYTSVDKLKEDYQKYISGKLSVDSLIESHIGLLSDSVTSFPK